MHSTTGKCTASAWRTLRCYKKKSVGCDSESSIQQTNFLYTEQQYAQHTALP